MMISSILLILWTLICIAGALSGVATLHNDPNPSAHYQAGVTAGYVVWWVFFWSVVVLPVYGFRRFLKQRSLKRNEHLQGEA